MERSSSTSAPPFRNPTSTRARRREDGVRLTSLRLAKASPSARRYQRGGSTGLARRFPGALTVPSSRVERGASRGRPRAPIRVRAQARSRAGVLANEGGGNDRHGSVRPRLALVTRGWSGYCTPGSASPLSATDEELLAALAAARGRQDLDAATLPRRSADPQTHEGADTRSAPLVGAVRFELTTSCTRNKRATRLRYAPNQGARR